MGFFERPDPRLAQSAGPTPAVAVLRAFQRHAFGIALCGAVMVAAYVVNVALGLHEAPSSRGTLVAAGLREAVRIVRDRRGIPHIRARNERDLYFAEGYVQASDRLFQLDLTRRYAYGRLAEVLGPKALSLDEAQRAVDVNGIAQRQLRALTPYERGALVAFSAGVNAAAAKQPLPVEFRMLLYAPAPWTPKDSLAVSIVASLELADPMRDVFARDAIWRRQGLRCFDALFPLSDERYDVTVDGERGGASPPSHAGACDATAVAALPQRRPIGSNAWAAGATRTFGGALLANDPHLDLTIPGIWYLVDIESPHVHAAGATIPGIPGVVLGHNERLAWASTNAGMATASFFDVGRLRARSWVSERFGVRFSRSVQLRYYRTAREFSVRNANDSSALALVRWPIYSETRSTISTALELDRARSVNEGLRVLERYRGSPQNFILADCGGAVAYHVAGLVPNDPAWARYVHPARDLRLDIAPVPFAQLPGTRPSRSAILLSANNKMYGRGYPYRLSAQFEPPYRAYRIAQLLRARARYDAAYFAHMQLDTLSPIDLEIARRVILSLSKDDTERPLQSWDGRYETDSYAAALEHALRLSVLTDGGAFYARLHALRSGTLEPNLSEEVSALAGRREMWRDAGGIRIEHVLAPMHFTFLDGAWLPGEGDEYTIHLQGSGIAQGFRAVWDTADWDRGGISIPSGESGEPGSGHYTDLTPDWIAGVLRPLPFTRTAVDKNAAAVLVLEPRK